MRNVTLRKYEKSMCNSVIVAAMVPLPFPKCLAPPTILIRFNLTGIIFHHWKESVRIFQRDRKNLEACQENLPPNSHTKTTRKKSPDTILSMGGKISSNLLKFKLQALLNLKIIRGNLHVSFTIEMKSG